MPAASARDAADRAATPAEDATSGARPAARGQERRTRIVEAALAVIARVGPDGLTHRLVAAEAGVPLAATTYWFASKEEIVEAAFLRSLDDALAELADRHEQVRTWTRANAAKRLARI